MVVIAFAACNTASAQNQALTVCMSEDNAPLSYIVKGESRGLDVRLAQAVAVELGRPLKVVSFESKYDQDSTLSQEVNAMLSSDVCDIASGFSMLATDLGPPTRATPRTGLPRREAPAAARLGAVAHAGCQPRLPRDGDGPGGA